MDIKTILELLRKGTSLEDIKLKALEDNADADLDAVAKNIVNAQKMIEQEKKEAQAAEAKAIADQKAADEKKIEELAQAKAEEILKAKKVDSVLEPKGAVQVTEQKGVWMSEHGEFIQLCAAKLTNKIDVAGESRLNELREKNFNSQADYYKKEFGIDIKATNSGMNVTTDASGGYFIRAEFDTQVDKLNYIGSELLEAVRVRPATEDLVINGIGTFNYTYRANDDTNITKTKPTLNQDTLALLDAGAIIPISNRLLSGSFYNLTSELLELSSDAEIRLLEQQITTGDDAESDEVFDGIWFTSGINTLVAKNSGGSGAIANSDFHNAYLTAAAQTRRKGTFLIRPEEFQYVWGLEDANGQPIGEKLFNNINGRWYHRGTGARVIIVDNMEGVNGVTNKNTQTEYPLIFGDLSRFRFYRKGGRQIDMSQHLYFDYNQLAMRFILENAQTIATNSKTSFVAVTGLKENSVV